MGHGSGRAPGLKKLIRVPDPAASLVLLQQSPLAFPCRLLRERVLPPGIRGACCLFFKSSLHCPLPFLKQQPLPHMGDSSCSSLGAPE